MSRTRKIRVKLPGYSAPMEIYATFVNPGRWFGKRWLVGFDEGFECDFYVIEADCEQDALDELIDSPWGERFKLSEEEAKDQDEDGIEPEYAGNYGDRVDWGEIRFLQAL